MQRERYGIIVNIDNPGWNFLYEGNLMVQNDRIFNRNQESEIRIASLVSELDFRKDTFDSCVKSNLKCLLLLSYYNFS